MAKQQKDSILIERFWDTYDFTDTIRLSSSATTEKMLVDYLSQLSELTEERACENIRRLVLKTKVNKVVNRWFLQRLEHHLYEPDSSLRNDSYYISVLEEALTSGHLDGMMRIRPLYQLKMLKKNRIGIKLLILLSFFLRENFKNYGMFPLNIRYYCFMIRIVFIVGNQ